MSEDENATTSGGHKQHQQQQQHQSNRDQDPNSSIIGKMRSRVSNILPQTLSKWFSPVSGDEGNRNGSLRRRRDEMQQNENTANLSGGNEDDGDGTTDDGGGGGDSDNDNDDAGISMPPSKKSKLNIEENYSTTNPYMASSSSITRNRDFLLSTSTPTTSPNRRRHLNLMQKDKDPPYLFSNTNVGHNSSSTQLSTIHHHRLSSNIVDEPRYMDDDMPDTDVLEVIPEHDEPIWDNNQAITSRRSLNIPSSSLRCQTLLNVRSTEPHNPIRLSNSPNDPNDEEIEEDEEIVLRRENRGNDDDDDENSDIGDGGGGEDCSRKRNNKGQLVLTNGKASRNVIQGGDTGSESGDSQYSSNLLQRQHQQKLSSSRLFGAAGVGSKSSLNRTTTSSNVGLNFYTHLEGKKSLFSDKTINMKNALNSSTTSLTSLNRRQSFNASLYGSTSALSDSRLLNISSPFYKGRTTYGGASAYSKYSQQQPLASSMMRISRTPTSIRPSSSLSSLSSNNSFAAAQGITAGGSGGGDMTTTTPPISSTAKRILELMNQFTTPLSDAKKMANTMKVPSLIDHKRRFNDDDLRQSRAIRMNAPKTPYSRPSPQHKIIRPSTMPSLNELHVPSMANLLQMKKLQNNIERVREIANASKSNLNAKEEYKLPTNVTQNLDSNSASSTASLAGCSSNSGGSSVSNSNNKHISKIRNKTTSMRNSTRNSNQDDETLPPVNLPEIPLPLMKSVPKIDITISTSSINSQKQEQRQPGLGIYSTMPPISLKSQKLLLQQQLAYQNQHSMVSKPRNENTPSCSSTTKNQRILSSSSSSPATIQQTEFKFSMPLKVANSMEKQHINIESVGKFNFSKPIPLEVTPATMEATLNKSQSTAFQNFKFLSPTTITSKSAEETRKSDAKFLLPGPIVPQLKTGSVLDALKKKEPASAQIEKHSDYNNSTGFGNQFKIPENKWECSVCMIRNDNSLDKCEACQTARKGSSAVTASASTSISSTANKSLTPVAATAVKNSFGDMFKPQSGSWECPDCMIMNENIVEECAACKAPKPGDKNRLSSLVSSSVPKTIQDDGFKNLVAQQTSKWECPACLTRNEQARSKCICCEQEKPGKKSPSTNVQRPNLFGATAAATATNSKFTFGFSPAQKEEELKKSSEKPAVTSSSNEKEKITAEVSSGNKGFSFGSSSSGMVSSSTFNTAQGAGSQPPLIFGFKPSSSSTDSASKIDVTAIKSGKDVTDVSTSNFKFGVNSASTQIPTKDTPNSTTTANSASTTIKTFTFGMNKPIVFDAKQNTTTGMTTFKFDSSAASTSANENKGQNTKDTSKPSETSSVIVSDALETQAIFGNPSSLTNVEKGESKATTTTSLSSSSSGFGSSSFGTPKPDSTADSSKNLFTFGGSSVNKSSTESDSNKKLNFSFGGSNSGEGSPAKKPTFSAFSPSNVQKSSDSDATASSKSLFSAPTATLTSSAAPAPAPAASTSAFTFGKPSASSPFAAASSGSGSITSTNTTTSIPTFGSSATITTSGSLFGGKSNITFGSASQPQQQQQQASSSSSIFGSSFSSASNNTSLQGSGNQPSNLFGFGSTAAPATAAKSESSGPVFGSVSSTTTTANKPFTFGGPSNQPTTTASSSPFVFGTAATQKPSESVPLFGSVASAGSGSSGFPAVTATVNSSQQQQQQTEPKSAFGQPLNPFVGSNVSSSNNTPAFGTNPSGGSSIFGSVAPTFGSTGFGTSNTTFGTNFGNNSSEVKKPESGPAFNFGSPPQGTSSGVFTFGAGNNNQEQPQQPFAFSANTAPSFNFSASQETPSNAPFQFSAAGALNPANNIFAPTPGSSTVATQQAARRKIRPRRTQPR